MNFLQLVQALHREAGVSGSAPATTVNQTGEAGRLVEWVKQAWLDIQHARTSWAWMRRQASKSTTVSVGSYLPTTFTDVRAATAVSNFSHWLIDTCSIYKDSLGQSDESELPYLPFDDWRRLYDFGSDASATNRPRHFTVDPADSAVRLGKKPDVAYTVRLDYYEPATDLSGDSGIPGMPAQFHMAIVYRALIYYGEYESAAESIAKGTSNFNRWMSRLELNQLPRMQMGPPLVS